MFLQDLKFVSIIFRSQLPDVPPISILCCNAQGLFFSTATDPKPRPGFLQWFRRAHGVFNRIILTLVGKAVILPHAFHYLKSVNELSYPYFWRIIPRESISDLLSAHPSSSNTQL